MRPGPHFSVDDVRRGWIKGLKSNGLDVIDFNFDDRLSVFGSAQLVGSDGEAAAAFSFEAVKEIACRDLWAACYQAQPDLVLVVSGFFTPPKFLEVMRDRGAKVVVLHTESPYEDDRQVSLAASATANLINDPTNLGAFREVNPATWYVPHAYDAEVHRPGRADPQRSSDVFFVGTGYRSRVEFLRQVDWSGIDLRLAGNWDAQLCGPLFDKVMSSECMANDEATWWARSAALSFNLYRQEAERPELAAGWAMGPREVELAASRVFFLRDPRGEGDEVLSMLPTFSDPAEFGELMRWWLKHPAERRQVAAAARKAVSQRTFPNHAADLLRRLF